MAEGGRHLEICAEIMSAHTLPKSVLVAFKSTEGMQCMYTRSIYPYTVYYVIITAFIHNT